MEPSFWHQRWELHQLGFHQTAVNPRLQRFFAQLAPSPGSQVFVPLCGKSNDMKWICQQGDGTRIVGVELSPIAIEAFFQGCGLDPVRRPIEGFVEFAAAHFRLLCGDFFHLTPDQLGPVSAVYDRAALVALPPLMRRAYAQHMASLLPSGSRMLLIGVDYPEGVRQGPPFSVPASEVQRLYQPWFELDTLSIEPRIEGEVRYTDTVYFLVRNGLSA